MERNELVEFLNHVEKIVESWPAWKRGILESSLKPQFEQARPPVENRIERRKSTATPPVGICNMDNRLPKRGYACVLQEWVLKIPMMQQTVLLVALRGPDGVPKYGPTKMLLRWYRRCILFSSLDGVVLTSPADKRGGSFTGPSFDSCEKPIKEASNFAKHQSWTFWMDEIVGDYLKNLDAIPHHFQLHLMHGIQILGYKHPDPKIRDWWYKVYARLVNDMHLCVEPEHVMDKRLGDTLEGWAENCDPATKD